MALMLILQVLREKLDDVVRSNDQLTDENKRLQIMAGRQTTTGSKISLARKTDDEQVKTAWCTIHVIGKPFTSRSVAYQNNTPNSVLIVNPPNGYMVLQHYITCNYN